MRVILTLWTLNYVDYVPFSCVDSFHIGHNWANWFKKILLDIFKKKEALRDIAKIEKSQIFGLFENKASYEDFFTHKCFKSCYGYFV